MNFPDHIWKRPTTVLKLFEHNCVNKRAIGQMYSLIMLFLHRTCKKFQLSCISITKFPHKHFSHIICMSVKILLSTYMINCEQDTTNITVNKCPLWEDDGNVQQQRTLLCQHPSTAKCTSSSTAGKSSHSFLKTEVSACKSWLCSQMTFCGTMLIRTSSVVTVSLNKGLNTLLTDCRPYPTRWWVTTNIHFTNKTGRRQPLGRWLFIRTDDQIRFLLIKIGFASPCLQL